MTHSVWNLQVLFSSHSLVQLVDTYMAYSPQLTGTTGEFVSNKNGWTELSWQYTASGAEQYLYIGNFQPNSMVDTLDISGGVTFGHYLYGAYYYIDDVRVSAKGPSFAAALPVSSGIRMFPNPCETNVTIQSTKQIIEVKVYALDGRIALRKWFGLESEIDLRLDDLVAGENFILTTTSDGKVDAKKLVKR